MKKKIKDKRNSFANKASKVSFVLLAQVVLESNIIHINFMISSSFVIAEVSEVFSSLH